MNHLLFCLEKQTTEDSSRRSASLRMMGRWGVEIADVRLLARSKNLVNPNCYFEIHVETVMAAWRVL